MIITLDLKKSAKKFIESLPSKHRRQIKESILSLQHTPIPHDAKKLMGYENYSRTDCGEYRIIYKYEQKKALITVVLIGKRNDSEVYRVAKRMLK